MWATAPATAAADVALPWSLRDGIDAAMGTAGGRSLNAIVGLMVGLVVALVAGHCLAIWLETRLFREAAFRLRQRVYAHVFGQRQGFFQRHGTGELVQRVGGDVQLLQSALIELFSDAPFSLSEAVGVLIMMALTDPRLTVGVLGGLAPSVRSLSRKSALASASIWSQHAFRPTKAKVRWRMYAMQV